MGTWSPNLFDDDLALDIKKDFEQQREAGHTPEEAADTVLETYEAQLDDDERVVLILVVASLLAECGKRHHSSVTQAISYIDNQKGLERWREAGDAALRSRQQVYSEILRQLTKPNRSLTKSRSGTPPRVGDILQIPLLDGRFGYARYLVGDRERGPLIEIYDKVVAQPLEAHELASARVLFGPIASGVHQGVKNEGWSIIGNREVKKFSMPYFVSRLQDKDRRSSVWYLISPKGDKLLGSNLPEKYRNLEPALLWPPHMVEERIRTGRNILAYDEQHWQGA